MMRKKTKTNVRYFLEKHIEFTCLETMERFCNTSLAVLFMLEKSITPSTKSDLAREKLPKRKQIFRNKHSHEHKPSVTTKEKTLLNRIKMAGKRKTNGMSIQMKAARTSNRVNPIHHPAFLVPI